MPSYLASQALSGHGLRSWHWGIVATVGLSVFACSFGDSGSDTGGNSGKGGGGIVIGSGGNGAGLGGGSSSNTGATANGGGVSVGTGGGSSSGDSSSVISADEAKRIEAQGCAGTKIEPESLPAVIQIVLDDSLSMSTKTPATNGETKWVITRAALKDTIANLPADIAVGLLYFPNMDTSAGTSPRDVSACVRTDAMIPIDVLGPDNSPQRQRLNASLDRTSPVGSTPTHDAYNYGLNDSLLLTKAPGARYMLLMTDGGPTLSLNCMGGGLLSTPQPQQPIIDAVTAARLAHGVKSFLVGVPGTEDIGNATHDDGRPWMSMAAVTGGTARAGCSVAGPNNWCHIDVSQAADFSAALRKGLNEIVGSIVSCSYEVPAEGNDGNPVNPNQINVIYTPGGLTVNELIKRDNSPACTDGWQLNNNVVSFCPNTCDMIKADTGAKLTLVFGCETQEVPIR